MTLFLPYPPFLYQVRSLNSPFWWCYLKRVYIISFKRNKPHKHMNNTCNPYITNNLPIEISHLTVRQISTWNSIPFQDLVDPSEKRKIDPNMLYYIFQNKKKSWIFIAMSFDKVWKSAMTLLHRAQAWLCQLMFT